MSEPWFIHYMSHVVSDEGMDATWFEPQQVHEDGLFSIFEWRKSKNFLKVFVRTTDDTVYTLVTSGQVIHFPKEQDLANAWAVLNGMKPRTKDVMEQLASAKPLPRGERLERAKKKQYSSFYRGSFPLYTTWYVAEKSDPEGWRKRAAPLRKAREEIRKLKEEVRQLKSQMESSRS